MMVGFLSSFIGTGFAKNLREEMFDKVYSFGMEDINKFSIGSLITRTTNDINHVQKLVTMGLQIAIKAPIMAIWAVSKIINKNYMLSGLTGIAVVLSGAIMFISMIIVMPKFKLIQRSTDKLNSVSRESLLGIRVIRAYNAEKYQEDKFEDVNSELAGLGKFTGRVMSFIWPCIDLVSYALTLAIYVVGAFIIQSAPDNMKLNNFSNVIVFSNYSSQVLSAFMMLSMIIVMYPRVSVAANRILEVINKKTSIVEGSYTSERDIGKVEFKNVSFKYPGSENYILRNVSFTAEPGETIAIVGCTGCGKSTLVNLIPRFYDVSSGEILIDEVNIKEYTNASLRSKIGYVPQRATILAGTVKENITYGYKHGNKPSDTDMIESAKIAKAEDFVLEMDGQYDSIISRGGNNISGGQKQRIQIARALARNPKIYIFDDSFSALDYKTDAEVRKEIQSKTKNSTKIIVSQRIGTIRYSDKIIMLHNGKIAGIGKHNELLNSSPEYKSLAEAQLAKEELYNV
jgi:ATP-binding cassette subfamily B protein